MRPFLTILVAITLGAGLAQAQDKQEAGPLELRLIARRTVYPVSKGEGVCFIAIDAELKNVSKERVLFLAAPEPELVLIGPRKESVRRTGGHHFFVPQETRTLFTPEEVRRTPLRKLTYRTGTSEFRLQWLEPGEYTLQAIYRYSPLPGTPDKKPTFFSVKSAPLKLTIREGSVTAYWADALSDKDIALRRIALLNLRDMGPSALPAAKAVLAIATSADPDIRKNAIHTAEAIGPKCKAEALPILLKALNDPDTKVKIAAIKALAHVAPAEKAVGPALLPLLRDFETDVRLAAAQAWHDMPFNGRRIEPGDTAALLRALQVEKVKEVRWGLISALCHHHQLDVLNALLPYLRGDDQYAKQTTLHTLGRLGAFMNRDRSKDAELGNPVQKTVAALIDAMKDKETHQAALYALAQFRADSAPAVPALLEALDAPANQSKDSLYHSRTRIVMALRDIGPPAKAASRTLAKRMLTDPDSSVRQYCVQALAAIGGDPREVGAALNQAMRDPMVQVRQEVPRALAKVGAIDALLDGLSDENPETRVAVIRGMGEAKAHAKKVVPALIKVLHEDKEVRCRSAAAYALWTLDTAEATPGLALALKDSDGNVRYIAADALLRFGAKAKAALPALIDCVKTDKATRVRERACWALMNINVKGHKELVPILVEMLGERDAELVMPAIYLVGQIGPDAIAARDHLRRLSQRKEPHGSAARQALAQIERAK